ncbi:MAG TPA: hypothetical protein PKW80_13425 [Bacteroidales bacterium]|nr:hypothetical protein [Bacteroidales bacterium]
MKKFIPRFILFILPLLLLFVLMEAFLRMIPNDYLLKKKYLDVHAEKIQTLVFGSSHAFRGINPEYFSGKTFNAGYVSQSLKYDYKIFEKYKHQMTALKTVVVPISYFSFVYELEHSIEAWRTKNYVIYYGFQNTASFKYYSELLSNSFKINVTRLVSYYIRGESSISSDSNGYGRLDITKNTDLERTGKEAAERHTVKDQAFVKDNCFYVQSIIEDCRKQGVQVILVTLPAWETYRVLLDSQQLIAMENNANNLSETYRNCIYINLLDDTDFVKNDFHSADHLNDAGAKKLSLKLNDIINQYNEQR